MLDQGFVYVDVRSEPEYEEGHPAGSINIPLMHLGPGGMKPNPDFVMVFEGIFSRDAEVIVGCKSGGRSLRAQAILTEAGFTSIVDQRAGFDGVRDGFGTATEKGWAEAGLPVEKGPSAGRSYPEVRDRATK